MSIRSVNLLAKSKPTLEGAGVHLRCAFGFGKTSDFHPLAHRYWLGVRSRPRPSAWSGHQNPHYTVPRIHTMLKSSFVPL